MTQIKCDTSPCFRQVCGGAGTLLWMTPDLTKISTGPHATSTTGWTIFSRKCWFITTQTFCGNRGPLTKSVSLGGRGLKSKAGRQARLLEEAPAPWLRRSPKTRKIQIGICSPSQAKEGRQLLPPHPLRGPDHPCWERALSLPENLLLPGSVQGKCQNCGDLRKSPLRHQETGQGVEICFLKAQTSDQRQD